MKQNELPLTEELDFAYLLELMPPLHNVDEFAWLPELFSILGHEKLITLCKYAGGETIRIPTLTELTDSIETLQWFYDVEITHTQSIESVPARLHKMYSKMLEVYNVRNYQESN